MPFQQGMQAIPLYARAPASPQ